MTGPEKGLLETYLSRQDATIARLDDRLSALERKHVEDQASTNARFTAVEHHLAEIAKQLASFGGTLNKLDGAADAANWVVENKGRILGAFAAVLLVFELITRIVVLWPLS